jgi:ketosteroid isomerase-like protein
MRRTTFVVAALLLAGVSTRGQDAMTGLADAERAFAQETAKVGIRDGFLAWFSKDSIGFRPTLGNAWEQLNARPKPPNPTAAHLEWEPRTGDVAASGELGWLTGPSTFTAPDGAKYYGNYLSVWKKTPEGWRVHIDVGADAPSPVAFPDGFVRMPAAAGRFAAPKAPADADASLTALKRADAAANTPDGFVTALADEARDHRPGSLQLVGKPPIVGAPEPRLKTATWTSSAADQARSLDLGYTYGRYEPPGTSGPSQSAAPKPGAGWYVRVWRKNASGTWQIVAQVDQPEGR